MNGWLLVILAIIAFGYLLDCTITLLTLRALRPELPAGFEDVYDVDKYARSQNYTKTRTCFALVVSTVTTSATLIFLMADGFDRLDLFARSFGYGQIGTGLIFLGILALLVYLLGLPFSIYSTFVIEARFGFNKTTPTTFLLDLFRAVLLSVLLGGPLLALLLWFFEIAGSFAWLYSWACVVFFSILVQFLAPVLIFPLFNKFSPLEEGKLRDEILAYAKRERFGIQGIFTMDGSKRSLKLNAFFTGFGRFRKIVFYDTLLNQLEIDEVVTILAHEMGHFKHKHIRIMILASILQTGVMFYFLSLLLNNPRLFAALDMTHVSVYASLVLFGFLYTPVNTVVSILFNCLSRQHEFEADAYAVRTTGKTVQFINGLKKLCQSNLTNLTPHPAVVFLEYTHPPVAARIRAVQRLAEGN